MQNGEGQVFPSVKAVIQCALSVEAKQCCNVDLIKYLFVWLIAGCFKPFSDTGFEVHLPDSRVVQPDYMGCPFIISMSIAAVMGYAGSCNLSER